MKNSDSCHFCYQSARGGKFLPKCNAEGYIESVLACYLCAAVYDVVVKNRPDLMSRYWDMTGNEIDAEEPSK